MWVCVGVWCVLCVFVVCVIHSVSVGCAVGRWGVWDVWALVGRAGSCTRGVGVGVFGSVWLLAVGWVVVLCCALSCRAGLCCVVLCYAVLDRAVLRCAVLCCAVSWV